MNQRSYCSVYEFFVYGSDSSDVFGGFRFVVVVGCGYCVVLSCDVL